MNVNGPPSMLEIFVRTLRLFAAHEIFRPVVMIVCWIAILMLGVTRLILNVFFLNWISQRLIVWDADVLEAAFAINRASSGMDWFIKNRLTRKPDDEQ